MTSLPQGPHCPWTADSKTDGQCGNRCSGQAFLKLPPSPQPRLLGPRSWEGQAWRLRATGSCSLCACRLCPADHLLFPKLLGTALSVTSFLVLAGRDNVPECIHMLIMVPLCIWAFLS